MSGNGKLYSIKHSITAEEMRQLASRERVSVQFLEESINRGTLVIPRNVNHPDARPIAVGAGVTTKVNANLGTSALASGWEEEAHKLEVAVRAGAHTVMDLSTGGDLHQIRQKFLDTSPLPLGTVPVYELACRCKEMNLANGFVDLPRELFFEVVEEQAEQGVDFFTLHAGVTRKAVEVLDRSSRVAGIVSRGGALMANWMQANHAENPYYEDFERLCNILRKYAATFSLGDGLRPGCIADASDDVQLTELFALGELTEIAWEHGVQVMIEGPGHVPLDQVKMNVQLQKRVCHGAPFYVLGPLVTDVAPGYDHITGAIGGALAAAAGADLLCYVTPSEHLALPDARDVHEGVIAFRIAAHSADLAKGVPGAREWDDGISRARKDFLWEEQIRLSIDPVRAREYRERDEIPLDYEGCTMCGDLCSMRQRSTDRLPH
ncbi:MAG: phosphomethylpyrimidine synthase [Candidatus Riflebacteria bacterium RBG_13_59_9]|nr:MAG: phosphomethylpyrimidine synthase [Candidatus Riflebacteria bacterium RBG_13_59_9]